MQKGFVYMSHQNYLQEINAWAFTWYHIVHIVVEAFNLMN